LFTENLKANGHIQRTRGADIWQFHVRTVEMKGIMEHPRLGRYFPRGTVFEPQPFCRALLFSTSSLCLYYFLLYEALRFRARARRSSKALRPRLTLRNIAWPKCIAGRRRSPPTAPASHGLGVSKKQLSRPLRVCQFQRKHVALGPFLRWRNWSSSVLYFVG
jgi:hypothetical protein